MMWRKRPDEWMKRNKNQIIMIICFFALILGPNLTAPFLGGFQGDGSAEKRELAEFPVFSPQDFEAYPGALEAYLNDHAAFRGPLLTLNAALNLSLFRYADSEDVIAGKDGWLFFTGGTELKDILGLNRFSPEDLAYISSCVKKTADFYREKGIDFLVVLPPNKSSVYRQYLPDGYEQVSEITKGEELSACLSGHSGITVIDPLSYMRENGDYLWYYKTDTHWNDAAGFVVSQMIIEALGGAPTPIGNVSVIYEAGEAGDLAGLFHMPESFADDVEAKIEGYEPDAVLSTEDRSGDGGIVLIENKNAPDRRRVAFYRDSFGMAIANTLPKYFKNVDFYHWQSFNASLLDENVPDVIIYEIAEREQGRIPDDMRALAPEAFAQ